MENPMDRLVPTLRSPLTGLLVTLLSACAGSRTPTPVAPAPAAPARGTGTTSHSRAMTLPVLEGFEQAVTRGTRTRSGAPGPKYWQQWAEDSLQAELNPISKRLR